MSWDSFIQSKYLNEWATPEVSFQFIYMKYSTLGIQRISLAIVLPSRRIVVSNNNTSLQPKKTELSVCFLRRGFVERENSIHYFFLRNDREI